MNHNKNISMSKTLLRAFLPNTVNLHFLKNIQQEAVS